MQKKHFLKPNKKGHPLKYIASFILPLILYADDRGPLFSENTAKSFKQEQETATAGVTKDISSQLASNMGPETQNKGTSDIMIVDPKIVSQDWKDAFNSLKSKKLTDIIFNLRDNTQISNVSDVEVLSGGYLMLFSLKTVQGIKYRIVKTSDIASIASK